MSRRHQSVLGKLSQERFLKDFWQKEPVVIRGAFPGLKDPLSPNELAGLSCEPHVDSRLVMERGFRKPWQVIRGPQRAASLRRLPPTHWTLLVESADRHSDRIAAFAGAFAFLPRWRMDDVMVSLAPLGGTVDAHIDSYDVFLIQGQGRRRWDVDRAAVADYQPGLDLRILKRFHVEDSWVLQPGDLLYVPPGVGHRGVTVSSEPEVALTYSVGFRAPSSADLLSSLLTRAFARETPRLFGDAGRDPVRDPGEISRADLLALRRFLVGTMRAGDDDDWTLAAGEAVTSGGGSGPARRQSAREVRRLMASATAHISRAPSARVSWARLGRGRAALFINGQSRVLPREMAFAAPLLCGRHSSMANRRLVAQPALVSLLLDLLRSGVLVLKAKWRSQLGGGS